MIPWYSRELVFNRVEKKTRPGTPTRFFFFFFYWEKMFIFNFQLQFLSRHPALLHFLEIINILSPFRFLLYPRLFSVFSSLAILLQTRFLTFHFENFPTLIFLCMRSVSLGFLPRWRIKNIINPC